MEQVVHIIPLGYEFDRAVKPFENKNGLRPNRVYLLSAIEFDDTPDAVVQKHRKFVDKVKDKLESLKIEVFLINTNLIDLLEVIKKISNIICKEMEQGNNVYINMSAAGRLTSVGATLAGMVHDVKVYYVESDDYSDNPIDMEEHGYTIVNEVRIKYLENFKIIMPDELQIKVLVEIVKRGKMRTLNIIEYLSNLNVEGFNIDYYKLSRSEKTAVIMKLNRNILDKLEQAGYLIKHKLGRENEFEVIESGRYIASISGLLE